MNNTTEGSHPAFLPPVATAKAFIAAINARDPVALGALMTDDHTFIDSGGATATGRDEIVAGWRSYYAMFPDFTIAANTIMQDGDVVAVFGSWTATYADPGNLALENRVGGPAAWKAQVEHGRIKSWQVYADHTRTLEVMQRAADRASASGRNRTAKKEGVAP